MQKFEQSHRGTVADVVQPVAGVGAIDHPNQSLHDIVHVGEVALHTPIVVEIDRPSPLDRFHKLEGRHIRPPPWSVDRKETQPGGGDAEQVRVAMSH